MAIHTDVLCGLVGILKLATLVIGVIDLGLIASSYWVWSGDQYFLAIVIILLLISVTFLILTIIGIQDLLTMDLTAFYMTDCIYHAIGGLLLLIGVIVWFVDVDRWPHFSYCGSYAYGYGFGNSYHGTCGDLGPTRIVAGVFGLINTIIYFVIALLACKASRSARPQPYLAPPQSA